MEITILLIWICFLFCLGLAAGGILVLFRKQGFKNISSFKFLRFAMILLYTFGFYSLWSKIFFRVIFNPTANQDLKSLSDFIAFIGTPFLLIGMSMFFLWGFNLLKEPPKTTLIGLGITLTIFAETVLLYLSEAALFRNVHQVYSLLVLLFVIPTITFLGFTELKFVKGKSKLITTLCVAIFGLIHLPAFFTNSLNLYFEIIFSFLFFLSITVLEIYFIYNAHWKINSVGKNLKDAGNSFKLFISKYAITSRESEVIKELYAGKTNKEIAENLFISLQTVKDHNHRIFQKTNVRSRSQLTSLLRDYQIEL